MPGLLAMLGGLLVNVTASVAGRAISALGIGFVAYSGMEQLLNTAKSYIQANLASLPADVLAILGLAGVGKALSIVFAAYAAKMTLKGVSASGSFVQSYMKGKG